MPQFGYQTLGFGGGASEVKYGPPAVTGVSVDTDATGATSQTCSHTVGAGVGRGLVVSISQYNPTGQGGPAIPTGVTYAGVSMTRLPFLSYTEYVHLTTTVWYLVAPATGTNNIVASFAATTTGASSIRGISFTGVKQGTGYYADGMVSASTSGTNNTGSSGLAYDIESLTPGAIHVDFLAIGIPGKSLLGYGGTPTNLAKGGTTSGTDIGAINSLQAGRYAVVPGGGELENHGWTWSDASGSPDGANYCWMTLKIQSDVYS